MKYPKLSPKRLIPALLLGGGALSLLAGCQHQALADREAEIRMQRLSYVPRVAAKSEASRIPRLRFMARHTDWYFRHQARHFDKNLKGAGAYIERNLTQAEERFPPYLQKGGEIIWGRPERIERTAIMLFW
jgi:hypothetical protein